MTIIRRPTALADVVSWPDAMERLFDERFFRPIWIGGSERRVAPALDLYTTPEAVIAKVALPGVKPEDVDVTVADDRVTISGTFKEEKETSEAGYVHRELSEGGFSRSFMLPTAIKADAATAQFRNGLLTLTLPKTEEVKPTHVKVQVSEV
jgi:HSP20 family protein